MTVDCRYANGASAHTPLGESFPQTPSFLIFIVGDHLSRTYFLAKRLISDQPHLPPQCHPGEGRDPYAESALKYSCSPDKNSNAAAFGSQPPLG